MYVCGPVGGYGGVRLCVRVCECLCSEGVLAFLRYSPRPWSPRWLRYSRVGGTAACGGRM